MFRPLTQSVLRIQRVETADSQVLPHDGTVRATSLGRGLNIQFSAPLSEQALTAFEGRQLINPVVALELLLPEPHDVDGRAFWGLAPNEFFGFHKVVLAGTVTEQANRRDRLHWQPAPPPNGGCSGCSRGWLFHLAQSRSWIVFSACCGCAEATSGPTVLTALVFSWMVKPPRILACEPVWICRVAMVFPAEALLSRSGSLQPMCHCRSYFPPASTSMSFPERSRAAAKAWRRPQSGCGGLILREPALNNEPGVMPKGNSLSRPLKAIHRLCRVAR